MVATRRKSTTPPVVKEEPVDQYAGYDDEDTAEADFIPDMDGMGFAALGREMFSTKIGKLRKAVLTPKQQVRLSVAWAFAGMMEVPELAALADMLADTTVSVKGRGLRQFVQVMTARMEAQDDVNGTNRLMRNMGL